MTDRTGSTDEGFGLVWWTGQRDVPTGRPKESDLRYQEEKGETCVENGKGAVRGPTYCESPRVSGSRGTLREER